MIGYLNCSDDVVFFGFYFKSISVGYVIKMVVKVTFFLYLAITGLSVRLIAITLTIAMNQKFSNQG